MLRGYMLVICAGLLWGLIGPLSKIAFLYGMGPMEVAFWRTSMGWVLFTAHAMVARQTRASLRDAPAFLAFGLLAIGGRYAVYSNAVEMGGAALAAVLLYTAPAWVAVLSRFLLHEPMTSIKLLAVCVTILGVVGVSWAPDLTSRPISTGAILLGLLSGITYALFYVFGKRWLNHYPTTTCFLYGMPAGALAMLPLFRFTPGLPWQAYAACAALAIVCTYGAFSIYYAGLRRLEATRAAMAATMEPLAAAVLAYAWYGETFSPLGYVGAALILSAVFVTIWDSARLHQRELKRTSDGQRG